jgi:cytoskeleton protein RodZ
MSDSMDETQDIRAAEMPVLGRHLAEAREAQGLSIEDVSNRLRLSARQIKALEEDDFTVLPEAMITRGFIRNYARLLELDPEPLLEAYRAQVPSEPPRPISISSANIPISDGSRRPWILYLLGSLLIAVLLGVWLYAQQRPGISTPNTTSVPIAEAPESTNPATVESLPVPALPLAERMGEQLPADESTAATATEVSPAAENAAVAPPPDGAAGSAAAIPGTGRLELAFSDTSWVSVLDGNNQEILNKIKPAGSREVVEGKPPFKLVIGNAAGSTLTYNGKSVDLEPHTRLNVARVTLE